MAKIYGLFGAMSGKIADVVMVVRNGEQIARKYQPVVSNPKSGAQVANRAKLKMLSQLSSVMSPIIAMPREGSVSSRNLFTRKNYPAASYADNQAQITLTSVKITNSVLALGSIFAVRGTNEITISTAGAVATEFDRVVYAAFGKSENGGLFYLGSAVSETRQGGFPGSIATSFTGEMIVYGYGVRINNEKTRVMFGQLETQSAETIAKLITTRSVSSEDISVSDTSAAVVALQA